MADRTKVKCGILLSYTDLRVVLFLTKMLGTRVYIGNLDHDVCKRDLERFFKNYGTKKEFFIKYGYGFVEFENNQDADKAILELNGKKLLGKTVSVEATRGVPIESRFVRTKYRMIVKNVSCIVSWQDLKKYMSQAGKVTYAYIYKRRKEGVIDFASGSDLKTAFDKLDNTMLGGRRIRLIADYHTEGRGRGRERSSRSRSRYRKCFPSSSTRSRSKSSGGKFKSPVKSRARSARR